MSLRSTTLSDAITCDQLVIGLASTAAVRAPETAVGTYPPSTIPFLFCEQEAMQVLTPPSMTQTVRVQRGALGTCAKPHAYGSEVLIGFALDISRLLPAPEVRK